MSTAVPRQEPQGVLSPYGGMFSRNTAVSRSGPHSPLFQQILTLTGALLGDGCLEKHGNGARLVISFKDIYKQVAEWYTIMLFGLGYHDKMSLTAPLVRTRASGLVSRYGILASKNQQS